MPAPLARHARTLGSGLLAAALVACASTGSTSDVDELIRLGEYDRAVEVATKRFEERPNDVVVGGDYKRAMVTWLLDRGRTLTFADRDEEALELFFGAREILPDNRLVAEWIGKTELKLADRWLTEAHTRINGDDLYGAKEAYETALLYAPSLPRAEQGLADTLIKINYRLGRAADYYKDSIGHVRLNALNQARSTLYYSMKYDPTDPRPRRKVARVEENLSQDHMVRARALEAKALFPAARNEYRIALLVDPTNVEAEEKMAELDVEVRVLRDLDEADMLVRRRFYDRAEELLDEIADLSERQADDVAKALERLESARLDEIYDNALVLVDDYQFEAAVAEFERLLSLSPNGYFRDARTRVDTLRSFIELAGDLYAQAAAAESVEEELSYLSQIEIFYPEYRDIEVRLHPERAPTPQAP